MKINNLLSAKTAFEPSDTAALSYTGDPVIQRILANPYVLLDERIRQIPEVQNLLQYPEIQQIFFDPSQLNLRLGNKKTETLLNIVRDWIAQNNSDEIFGNAERLRLENSGRQSSAGITGNTTNSRNSGITFHGNPVVAIIFIIVFFIMFFVTVLGSVMSRPI